MRTIITALLCASMLLISPAVGSIPVSARTQHCTGWELRHTPPPYIRVYLPRGKRVIKVPFKEYVGHVMAAGASPVASYRNFDAHAVMAFAIMNYAWWETNHPSDLKRSPSGQCYDIRNGGWDHAQYVKPYSGWRWPNALQRRAIDAVWGWRARTRTRFVRTGWTAGYGGKCKTHNDGWHLPEDETTTCARNGWEWKRIVTTYLSCCTLVQAYKE